MKINFGKYGWIEINHLIGKDRLYIERILYSSRDEEMKNVILEQISLWANQFVDKLKEYKVMSPTQLSPDISFLLRIDNRFHIFDCDKIKGVWRKDFDKNSKKYPDEVSVFFNNKDNSKYRRAIYICPVVLKRKILTEKIKRKKNNMII